MKLIVTQLEGGASWSDVLERQLAMVKRALKRDSGHEARAKEFNPENITQGVPTRTAWAYGWAVVWMLGCVQLVHLKVTDIRLNFVKKTVTLNIKKSKMGQEALGVKRTLRCCNNTSCLRLCPWNMVTGSRQTMQIHPRQHPLSPTFGTQVQKVKMVKAWMETSDEGMSGH